MCLFRGLLDEVGAAALEARREPDPDQCCVQLVER
jgi:hypothetical protein